MIWFVRPQGVVALFGIVLLVMVGGKWGSKLIEKPSVLWGETAGSLPQESVRAAPSYTKREAWVRVDTSLIERWVDGEKAVALDLMDLGRVEVEVDHRQVVDKRFVILQGRLKGQPRSRVTLSVAGAAEESPFEALAGTVSLESGRTFRIDYVGEKRHRLSEITHEVADYCEHGPQSGGILAGKNGEAIPLVYQRVGLKAAPPVRESGREYALERILPHLRVRASTKLQGHENRGYSRRITLRLPHRIMGPPQIPAGGASPMVIQSPTTGSPEEINVEKTMDVMILYTQEAAQSRGGEAGVRALAGLAVGNVNAAFRNSGVDAALRLVAVERWLHQSTGDIGGDVRALATDPTIAALRTRHNADLVAGFVGGQALGAVGVGSLLMNPAGQPQACWSVVRAEAVGAPFYTFAHEIGHNLGCNHAADQGAEVGAFSYSHGWRFIGGNGQKYRTLLSYQRFPNERRIPYFSSPHKRYQKAAAGATMADNARTINQTVSKVADYR